MREYSANLFISTAPHTADLDLTAPGPAADRRLSQLHHRKRPAHHGHADIPFRDLRVARLQPPFKLGSQAKLSSPCSQASAPVLAGWHWRCCCMRSSTSPTATASIASSAAQVLRRCQRGFAAASRRGARVLRAGRRHRLYLVYRFARPLVSIKKAVARTTRACRSSRRLRTRCCRSSRFALGSPLGREVAPREIGSLFAGWLSYRAGLSVEETRIMVACGAGAGLAAVYNVPLGRCGIRTRSPDRHLQSAHADPRARDLGDRSPRRLDRARR